MTQKHKKFKQKLEILNNSSIVFDPVMDFHVSRNLFEVAKKYNEPYSNIRRYIYDEIKQRGIEDEFIQQEFEVEDFNYLQIGDSFQFDEHLTIWKVLCKTKKSADLIWILVPTKEKSERHWICDELQ